jgi:putative membrane protein
MKKILVLSVDRDDDLGRKTGIQGPVLGREPLLEAATKLCMSDPTESDANVLFGAVKVYDEYKEEGEVRVAAVTGNEDVGVKSDMVIADQLEKIFSEWNPEGLILVTDGKEDENILPILQGKAPIISIERIVVQQSEKIEDTYFILHRYFDEIWDDPRTRALIIGLPGLAILVVGIFYFLDLQKYIWPTIWVMVGLYLAMKGFGIYKTMTEILSFKGMSFFTYLAAIILGFWAIYNSLTSTPALYTTPFPSNVALFITGTNYLLSIALLIIVLGMAFNAYSKSSHNLWHYSRILVASLAFLLIVEFASRFILDPLFISERELLFASLGAMVFTILTFYVSYKKETTQEKKEIQ